MIEENPLTVEEKRKARFDADPTKLIRLADNGLFVACAGAILAVYILDIIFFAAWAGETYLVPVFMLIGFVIRTIAVVTGVVLQNLRGMPEIRVARATLRFLWVGAIALCLIPAMSFFAGGNKANTQLADVSEATTEATVSNNQTLLDLIDEEIADLEADRDAAVADSQAQIELIANDGVAGISRADNEQIEGIRADIAQTRENYKALIEEKRAEKRTALTETEEVQVENAEETTKISSFYAIFAVLEDITPYSSRDLSLIALFAFALFIEALAAFGLGAYYDAHRFFIRKLREMELEQLEHEEEVSGKGTTQGDGTEEGSGGEDQDGEETGGEESQEQEKDEFDVTGANQTPQDLRSSKGGRASAFLKNGRKVKKIPIADHQKMDEAA